MKLKQIKRSAIVVTLTVATTLFVCMTSCKTSAVEPVKNYSVGTELPNIVVAGESYAKTSEIVIIEKDTIAVVYKGDNSSYASYYSGENSDYCGEFYEHRSVKLSPFIMGKYEVTQELYEAVMKANPSEFKGTDSDKVVADGETQALRPVENVTWYEAVAFCNKLTKATMSADECVYYTESTFSKVYESGTKIYTNLAKKGYRLPTEAEWEFAARGGNPKDTKWGYAYAGVQTTNPPTNSFTYDADSSLNDFGWYGSNSDDKTHEVGTTLKQNALGLCDMSGNVWEWCYDWYDESLPLNVTNPEGATSGTARVNRGGGGTSMRTAVLFLSETVTIQLLLLITLVFVFAVPICKFDAVQESRLGEFVIKLPHPFFLL